MDNSIYRKKAYLEFLVRIHTTTEANTPEEHRIFRRLDHDVNELLRLGVPEAEIEQIINVAQERQQHHQIPDYATRRYMTPSQRRRYHVYLDFLNNNDATYYPPGPDQLVRGVFIDLEILERIVREHLNTEANTPEEQRLHDTLDQMVTRLSNQGVSDVIILRAIQLQGVDGIRLPLAITRYILPVEREAIERRMEEMEHEQNNMFDDDFNDAFLDDNEDEDEPIPQDAPLAAEPLAALIAREATAAPTATMQNRYDFLNDEGEDLDSKDLEQYKDMMRCEICLTNIKDVRLSPCDHQFCKTCVKSLINRRETKCPKCRVTFTSVNKVYYNKYLKYKMKYFALKNKRN